MNGIVLKTVKAKLYCVECGDVLTGNKTKFCSKPCRRKYEYLRTSTRPRNVYLSNCVVCGNALSGSQEKFCSDTCKTKDSRQRRSVLVPPKNCTECGSPLKKGRQQFCSEECSRKRDRTKSQTTRQRMKIYYAKILGGKCAECSYNKNIAALCFHHLDPSKKTFSLTSHTLAVTEESVVLAELETCVLLCQNCHMEIHHPELEGLLDTTVTTPQPSTPDPCSGTPHENVVSLPVRRIKEETSPVVAHTT